jgi:hypothetical protein
MNHDPVRHTFWSLSGGVLVSSEHFEFQGQLDGEQTTDFSLSIVDDG